MIKTQAFWIPALAPKSLKVHWDFFDTLRWENLTNLPHWIIKWKSGIIYQQNDLKRWSFYKHSSDLAFE